MVQLAVSSELSELDQRIAVMRANGEPVGRISAAVNKSPDVIYRRLRKPAVRAAVGEAVALGLRPQFEQARGGLSAALTRLIAIVENPAASDQVAVKAAAALVDAVLRLNKVTVEAQGLAVVEQQLAELQAARGLNPDHAEGDDE